jgi:glycosyltransferase involved in cell wall biosynthesis
VLRQLALENDVQALVGHYGDGGAVVKEASRIASEYNVPDFKKLWVLHSTGKLKASKLEKAGIDVDDKLHIPERSATEQSVFNDPSIRVIAYSKDLFDSAQQQYNRSNVDYIPLGMDLDKFSPRPDGVSKDDARYDKTWNMLEQISMMSLREMQEAKIVLEYSRTTPTKGKDDVLRAFAYALERSDTTMLLIINIPDPSKDTQMSDEEKGEGVRLQALIDELGIRPYVAYKRSFSPDDVAQLGQLSDIYVTGAKMETWGLSAAEAAACGLPLISADSVPCANELFIAGAAPEGINGGSIRLGGAGALFSPSNSEEAGIALSFLLKDLDPSVLAGLGKESRRLAEQVDWNVVGRRYLYEVAELEAPITPVPRENTVPVN